MELKIRFEAEPHYAVSKTANTVGLDYVAKVRDAAEDQNLSLDKIPGDIESICQNPIIDISEKLAVASGLFKKTHYIQVIVTDYGLNKYVFPDFEIEKNPETGDVINITSKYSIDCEQVLKDWKEEGCPLLWNIF